MKKRRHGKTSVKTNEKKKNKKHEGDNIDKGKIYWKRFRIWIFVRFSSFSTSGSFSPLRKIMRLRWD